MFWPGKYRAYPPGERLWRYVNFPRSPTQRRDKTRLQAWQGASVDVRCTRPVALTNGNTLGGVQSSASSAIIRQAGLGGRRGEARGTRACPCASVSNLRRSVGGCGGQRAASKQASNTVPPTQTPAEAETLWPKQNTPAHAHGCFPAHSTWRASPPCRIQ